MIKILLLLLPLILLSKIVQTGDNIVPIKLMSQHNKEHVLVESGIWIISWDKQTTRVANNYFENNKMQSNTNLLVDVSQAPSGIFNLFILPRMQKYKHTILLSFSEAYNKTLPYSENKLTILYIKNNLIENIKFVEDMAQLDEALK